MGQFSFRVSSTVTVRKWLELGSSQRFFSLMCLILESGRLKKLGLWGYFSLSLSWSDSPKGILQMVQTLQISPWISRSSSASPALHSAWQSQRPSWFQEKGHGLYLLWEEGQRIWRFKIIMCPLMLFFPQSHSSLLSVQPMSPVSCEARLPCMLTR